MIKLNLKRLRTKRNLSISELSKSTGMSKNFLERLENGNAKSISYKNLNSLCHVFQLESVNELFF